MRTIYSLILPLYFLAACTKDVNEIAPNCTPVAIYSDKYTIDTLYLKTDTLYKSCLTGHWLNVHRQGKDDWFGNFCDTSYYFKIEHLRYITGNEKKEIYRKK